MSVNKLPQCRAFMFVGGALIAGGGLVGNKPRARIEVERLGRLSTPQRSKRATIFGHEAAGSFFRQPALWPIQRSRAAYVARFHGPNDSGNSSPNVTVRRRPS